jgi:hypothetical protein
MAATDSPITASNPFTIEIHDRQVTTGTPEADNCGGGGCGCNSPTDRPIAIGDLPPGNALAMGSPTDSN